MSAESLAVDDADIIAGSREDPEMFAALFDRYSVMLHRYVHRRLGPDIAEDVVAETFLAAFRRRNGFDPARGDVRPWLFGIATRLIARHRRTEAARYRAAARAPVEHTQDFPADRIAAEVSAHAARTVLVKALAGLNAGELDVLLLIAWAQLSYEETAAALEVPIGTVRSRLNRARTKVRTALNGVDPTREQSDG
ncbi:RNA polymerase sigma factor [Thermomonospora umbrina]|nr:RNA polymerase sigma factor [Thermomonospora umbrina]